MTVVEVPFEREAVPAALDALLPPEVRGRWTAADRSPYGPVVVAVEDDGTWTGAALVTGRPSAAYSKVVDTVGDVRTVLAAVEERARALGHVQVKWEGWTADPAVAAGAGFVPLPAPLAAPADATQPGTAWVRWLLADGASEPSAPYYRQSTHFSCGAVTALLAQVGAGAVAADDLDREAELTLWRTATNFPACEPVGLGVAVRRAWPSSPVRVHLDVDRPVVLASYTEDEQAWRAVLQRASRAEAAGLGLVVDPVRLGLDDLRAAFAAGERVLLLLSVGALHGFDAPHWVLGHAAVDGAVVVQDTWVNAGAGDTWVDGHLLPVPDASLEAMWALEDDRFRGAVRIGPPGP